MGLGSWLDSGYVPRPLFSSDQTGVLRKSLVGLRCSFIARPKCHPGRDDVQSGPSTSHRRLLPSSSVTAVLPHVRHQYTEFRETPGGREHGVENKKDVPGVEKEGCAVRKVAYWHSQKVHPTHTHLL